MSLEIFAENKNDVYLQRIKRWFFDIKYCLVKQLSCIYNKYHCLSGVCGTHGNKSGPVIGLVREAHPVG